jgi:hypothetical protein
MTWLVFRTVTWLVTAFRLELSRPLEDFRTIVLSLDKILVSQSPTGLVLYCKEVRLCLYRYLSGKPIKSKLIGLTKDGIPIILGPFIPQIRLGSISADSLRLLTTIFCATRALSLGKEADFSPIIDASSYELPSNLWITATSFVRELGFWRKSLSVPKMCRFSTFHGTTKVSPYLPGRNDPNSKCNAL